MEVVRKPLRVRERSSRTLDQRFFMRFPRLATAGTRLIARLPPRSRVRQALLWRGMRLAMEAYNRRDLDVLAPSYHPDFEYHPARKWIESGLLEPSYSGLAGHKAYVESTAEVFGTEIYVKPTELIDAGHKVALLSNVPMRAQGSGIELTEWFAIVFTIEDGLVIRVDEHYDRAEAMAEVGLSE